MLVKLSVIDNEIQGEEKIVIDKEIQGEKKKSPTPRMQSVVNGNIASYPIGSPNFVTT